MNGISKWWFIFRTRVAPFAFTKKKKQTNNKQTFSSDSDFHTDYWLTRQRWCFTVIDFCSLRRLAVRENRQSSESWHLFSWSFSLTVDDSFISKALSSNLAILLGSLTKTFFIKKKCRFNTYMHRCILHNDDTTLLLLLFKKF